VEALINYIYAISLMLAYTQGHARMGHMAASQM